MLEKLPETPLVIARDLTVPDVYNSRNIIYEYASRNQKLTSELCLCFRFAEIFRGKFYPYESIGQHSIQPPAQTILSRV